MQVIVCLIRRRVQIAYVRALLVTLLFIPLHHLSTMPPRKKVKTDHVHEGATTGTRRTTRANSKAANTVTAEASDVQPTVAASVAPAVVKLRRGCLKEIPNFAVEIQLMVCLSPVAFRIHLITTRLDLWKLTPAGSFQFVSHLQGIPRLLPASQQRSPLGGGFGERRRFARETAVLEYPSVHPLALLDALPCKTFEHHIVICLYSTFTCRTVVAPTSARLYGRGLLVTVPIVCRKCE